MLHGKNGINSFDVQPSEVIPLQGVFHVIYSARKSSFDPFINNQIWSKNTYLQLDRWSKVDKQ